MKKRHIITWFMFLCFSLGVKAQDSPWSVNIYDYQYDMTLYFSLSQNGTIVDNLSDYVVAAFCGDECRGVSQILTAEKDEQTVNIGYLRIRSNKQDGEIITFRVYSKTAKVMAAIKTPTIAFQSTAVTGLPSSPFTLSLPKLIQGDVNSDGKVDITDVTTTISYILGEKPEAFDEAAADVNCDGKVNIVDVTTIIDIILKKG